MWNFIRVLMIIALLFVMAAPLLPLPAKWKRFSTFRALRYDPPHNRKNFFFVLLSITELVLFSLLASLLTNFASFIQGLPFIGSLLGSVNGQVQFSVAVAVRVVLFNLIILYTMVILKAFFKKVLLDPLYGMAKWTGFFHNLFRRKKNKKDKKGKKGKKGKKTEEATSAEDETTSTEEEDVPQFVHSDEEDPEKKPDGTPSEGTADKKGKKARNFEKEHPILAKIRNAILGVFFEGTNFERAKPWLLRCVAVVQLFIYLTEIAYGIVFLGFLIALFFPAPAFLYGILNFFVENIFLYPFIALIILQEICNTFRTKAAEEKKKEDAEASETGEEASDGEDEEAARKKRLARLDLKLRRQFGEEHSIRYYASKRKRGKVPEYHAANEVYTPAINFIKAHMKHSAGYVVQSYMKGLDYAFMDNHVYFGASFYSQLGEYLIAYAYVRLLAGERVIFVTSDRRKAQELKKYIGRRLTALTYTNDTCTWRIRTYDAAERLEQTDVLILVPEDFLRDDIVEYNLGFFEEAEHAFFVDADRILNLNSYLCPVMARRLQSATNNRIRFLFTTRDIIYGFTKSLHKFFSIVEEEAIKEVNSADENEHVSYYLWNREGSVIYDHHGQKALTPEVLIAKAAYEAKVDGIRVMTGVPFDVTEREELRSHRMEINDLYKDIPEVNYLICTDDRFNLAAALYAYTRFRGKKESILHILSYPYLLREYFKSNITKYVNNSSLIKPFVTEHVDQIRFRLLGLFLNATAGEDGMLLSEFLDRLAKIMEVPAFEVTTDPEKLKAPVESFFRELKGGEELDKPDIKDYYRLSFTEDRFRLHQSARITFLHAEEIFASLNACNRRVSLWLNDKQVGLLDIFPTRVYQHFLPRQSIVYNNVEYNIQRICEDGARIELDQPNITYRNVLDTFFLKRFRITDVGETVEEGKNTHSAGTLRAITLSLYRKAKMEGDTYGYFDLSTDSQTLDFKTNDVEGDPALPTEMIEENRRRIQNGGYLSIRLTSAEECNDKMRLLLSVVLNEFIRSRFPFSYRCISVCPVLENAAGEGYEGFEKQVATLYPELGRDSAIFTEGRDFTHEIELLVINDCVEDVGALDQLITHRAEIVEEFLSHVYSYLVWLKGNPVLPSDQKHYIYFGGEELPSVFDLDGCIDLLSNCARQYVSATDEEEQTPDDEKERCSFCHAILEEGRKERFGKNRWICFDCECSIPFRPSEAQKAFTDAIEEAFRYLKNTYPSVKFPTDVKVLRGPVYEPEKGAELSENYYRINVDERTVEIEKDNPKLNTMISAIRGRLYFWQKDNNVLNGYSYAQLCYEELRFLEKHGEEEWIEWLRSKLDEATLEAVATIETYVSEAPEGEVRNSFTFMLTVAAEDPTGEENEDLPGTEEANYLFDPDTVPRFWKQYLMGKHASDEEDDASTVKSDTEDGSSDPVTEEGEGEEAPAEGEAAKKPEEKKEKKAKHTFKTGEELFPHEEIEDSNPKIKLYNEIGRNIANFNMSFVPIPRGVSLEEAKRIVQLVVYDYPEFFWAANGYEWMGDSAIRPSFCCRKSETEFDMALIKKNRDEIRRAAAPFLKGITRKTPPFEALLTIYRRVIKSFDYDTKRLNEQKARGSIGIHGEDEVRSLHSALVDKKVVCVGYAVAMQYLLQSVGICCGQVVSGKHSWNVVKLGKSCYFLDATWGDRSNTVESDSNENIIHYEYFCVTSAENLLVANPDQAEDRILNPQLFYDLEQFTSTKHNFYRHEQCYLTSYDEEALAQAFAKQLLAGDPTVTFRCSSQSVLNCVHAELFRNGRIEAVIQKVREAVSQRNRKLGKQISSWGVYPTDPVFYTTYITLFR